MTDRMTIEYLKKECQYCYREIDTSGLEGFRCTNRAVIIATGSSWCRPKNANEPCSICKYCRPGEEIGMATEEKLKARGIKLATTYEVTAKMNLKPFIDESREIAQAFTEFADNLEQIEKKYAEPQEIEG